MKLKKGNLTFLFNQLADFLLLRPLLLIALFLVGESFIAIKTDSIIPFFLSLLPLFFALLIKKKEKMIYVSIMVILFSIYCCFYIFSINSKWISEKVKDNALVCHVVKIERRLDDSSRIVLESDKYGLIMWNSSVDAAVNLGDVLILDAVLKNPEGPTNYGEFDYSKYLNEMGINAIIYPKSFEVVSSDVFLSNIDKLSKSFFQLKRRISECFNTNREIATSVFLGDTTLLSSEYRNYFKNAGCSHLLAVSGTHFSGFLTAVPFLFEKLKLKARTKNIVYFVFVLAIGFLTGWTSSVTRAAIMSTIAYLFRDSISGMSFAAIMIVVANPYNAVSLGFLMSFSCAICIALFSKRISSFLEENFIKYKYADLLSVAISSQIGIIPFWFQTNSKIGLFTMPIQIVESTLASVGCALFVPIIIVSLIFGSRFVFLLELLISLMVYIVKMFDKIPQFTIDLAGVGVVFSMLLFCLIFLILLRRCLLKKLLLIPVCFLIAFIIGSNLFSYLNMPESKVVFIDVGQGDSCLIVSKGKSVLIDGGTYDKGLNAVEPVLDYYSISKVDVAVMTHWDQDHAGGIAALYNEGRIERLCTSFVEVNESVSTFITNNFDIDCDVFEFLDHVELIRAGDEIQLSSNSVLKCISPINVYDGENEDSVVLLFECFDFSCLLTGDIGVETESTLVKTNQLSNCDVLKVAHHGSKYSTSDDFLNCISPQYAVISVGRNNDYGHPSQEVIERLEQHEISVLETKDLGAIEIKVYKTEWVYDVFLS